MRSEFDFINDIKSRYNLERVGDDCAVLPRDDRSDLLITSDMLVENVDFRLDWYSPEQVGHKALAVSLSDIAAMGGTPTHAMLSIAVVEKLWKHDFLDRFYSGWHQLALDCGVELVGGDVSSTSGPLTIDSTVLGSVPKGKAILRSGARPGDTVYVSGTLGGAAGGLAALQQHGPARAREHEVLVNSQRHPLPQLALSKLLQNNDLASAMIDLSDGLSSDLLHICNASGVGAELWLETLPIEPALTAYWDRERCLDLALNGGEDFELLFTAEDIVEIQGVTAIGRITARPGVLETLEGQSRSGIAPRGFQHFERDGPD